jgi:hypothetical protein
MSESEFTVRVNEDLAVLPVDLDVEAKAHDRTLTSGTSALVHFLQWVFSFPALLGALLVGGVAIISRTFFLDPDVWWHIKQGGVILATHHVPTKDIYSLTLTGRPWTAYEWLGDLLLAATYQIDGFRALEGLLIILGAAILIALYTLAAIRCANSKAAFVATASLFVMATVSFNLRPQMLGYLFLILTLIALERFRIGKRRAVWALPILMLVWVNAHGSWIIGLGIIAVYLVSGLIEFHIGDIEARRWNASDRLQLASVLGLSLCATVITPYGTGLAKYPFQVAFSLPLGVANVIEWQPMPFGSPLGKLFLVALLGVIVAQVVYHMTWRLEELLLFLFATTEACMHIRFLLIFVPIFAPILATALNRWIPRYQRTQDRPLLNAALIGVIVALIAWFFPSQAELQRSAGKSYPVDAIEYLNNHAVPGPMFNTYGFGGYLIFARGPEHKVFMDGRSELYERGGVLADYLEIEDIRPDALSLLQKYGFQSCLLNHDAPLATVLAALPEWQKIYEDSTSILFVRRSGSPPLVAKSSGDAPKTALGL